MEIIDTLALTLRNWHFNRRDDYRVYNAYRQCVVSSVEPRDRIFYLDMMASMRRCIATDNRQIKAILHDMSLCANCAKTADCACEPPF